jgi:hypothetical protein
LMEAEGGGAATAETVDAVETKAPEALDPAEHWGHTKLGKLLMGRNSSGNENWKGPSL